MELTKVNKYKISFGKSRYSRYYTVIKAESEKQALEIFKNEKKQEGYKRMPSNIQISIYN